MAKTVFYSFHYSRDVHRVQVVRNIQSLQGQPILNSQQWESVRRAGPEGIKRWIDGEMSYKRAVIVLVGQKTAERPWVKYEIERAWTLKKPLLGIRIHAISSMGSVDSAGQDPFREAGLRGVPLFDPTVTTWLGGIDSRATYQKLSANIETWASAGATRR